MANESPGTRASKLLSTADSASQKDGAGVAQEKEVLEDAKEGL